MNGFNIPSTDDGRTVRFDLIPTLMLNNAAWERTTDAALRTDVSGYVNLTTFDPFSQPGLSLTAAGGAGQQNIGNDLTHELGARVSWSGEHIGFYVFQSQNRIDLIRDYRTYNLGNNDDGELLVHELGFGNNLINNRSDSDGFHLEYRGAEYLQRAYASGYFSKSRDIEKYTQYEFDLTSYVWGSPTSPAGVTYEEFPLNRMDHNYGYENRSSRIWDRSAGLELLIRDWRIKGNLSLNKTISDHNLTWLSNQFYGLSDYYYEYGIPADPFLISYDLTDVEDPLLFIEGNLPSDSFEQNNPMAVHQYLSLDQYYENLHINSSHFRIDAEKSVDIFNTPSSLAIGIQSDTRLAFGDFAEKPQGETFPDIQLEGGYDTGKPWESLTTNSIHATYSDIDALHKELLSAGALRAAVDRFSHVDSEERILSGYIKSDTQNSLGQTILSVRLEKTEYKSEGFIGDGYRIKKHDYLNVLPSLKIHNVLGDALTWDNSLTTSIRRPDFKQSRAATTLANGSAEGGNPRLNPEVSSELRSSIYWNYSTSGILMASAFYRQIDDVIYFGTESQDGEYYRTPYAGQEILFTGFINGSDGTLKGIELDGTYKLDSLVNGPLSGLGIRANSAFMSGSFKNAQGDVLDLPDLANRVINVMVFYEKYDFFAQFMYRYRSEIKSSETLNLPPQSDRKRLDFIGQYDMPWMPGNIESVIYLRIENLTGEIDSQYATDGNIRYSERFGRSYLAGIKINY